MGGSIYLLNFINILPDPFPSISGFATLALLMLYFGSFFIRGALGFGSGVPAVLLGSLILGPHHAVLLLLTSSCVSHAQFISYGLRHAEWNLARPIMVCLIPGVIIGVWVFQELPPAWLNLLLGIVISGIITLSFTNIVAEFSQRAVFRSPWISGSLACLSGWIAGAVGAGGMYVLAAYLRIVCSCAKQLRATGFTLSTVTIFGRLVTASLAGIISPQLFIETIALAPIILIGGWTGAKVSRRLPSARFDLCFRIFLLTISSIVILKGFFELGWQHYPWLKSL